MAFFDVPSGFRGFRVRAEYGHGADRNARDGSHVRDERILFGTHRTADGLGWTNRHGSALFVVHVRDQNRACAAFELGDSRLGAAVEVFVFSACFGEQFRQTLVVGRFFGVDARADVQVSGGVHREPWLGAALGANLHGRFRLFHFEVQFGVTEDPDPAAFFVDEHRTLWVNGDTIDRLFEFVCSAYLYTGGRVLEQNVVFGGFCFGILGAGDIHVARGGIFRAFDRAVVHRDLSREGHGELPRIFLARGFPFGAEHRRELLDTVVFAIGDVYLAAGVVDGDAGGMRELSFALARRSEAEAEDAFARNLCFRAGAPCCGGAQRRHADRAEGHQQAAREEAVSPGDGTSSARATGALPRRTASEP